MKLLKLVDGMPVKYSLRQLREDNPGVSFPGEKSANFLGALSRFNVFPYIIADHPSVDYDTEVVTEGEFRQVNGAWVLEMVVQRLPEEEASDHVRAKRNDLLDASDWRFLSDQSPSAEWAQYRQALRDVPLQPGFPYNVTWPEEPSAP